MDYLWISGTGTRNIWESYLCPQMICRLCSDPLLLISWRTVCARLVCTKKNIPVDCDDTALKRHIFFVDYRAQCECPQLKYYYVRDDGVNSHMGWRASILWSSKIDFDHQKWNRPLIWTTTVFFRLESYDKCPIAEMCGRFSPLKRALWLDDI